MNRRNAILGWATWTVLSQLLRRSRPSRPAPVEEESSHRIARWRNEEPPPKKKRKTLRVVAVISAALLGFGIWMGARRARSEPVE